MKTARRNISVIHVSIIDLFRLFAVTTLTQIVLTTLCNAPLTAGEGLSSEPYSVFVAYDKAFARCGPSSEYYRTDPLRHGQKLEVYVETEDGWLGVRPPEESFCWVPASTIETSDRGQSGEVIEDRTVAWIGTNLGRAKRYRWQVQLAEGEPVTIIGRSEREGPDGPQLWYRIVPPSGEFRWIHRDQIVGSAEALVAKATQENDDKLAENNPPRGTKPSISRFGNLADRGKSILAKAMPGNAAEVGEPNIATIQPAQDKKQMEMQVSELLSSTRGANDPINAGQTPDVVIGQQSSRRTKPLVGNTANNSLQPVPTSRTPVLNAAPQPQVASQPNSKIASATNNTMRSEAVGSGLDSQWQPGVSSNASQNLAVQNVASSSLEVLAAPVRREPQLANADFVSRPRLIDIGSTVQTSAPGYADVANDNNWVVGSARQHAQSPSQPIPGSLLAHGQARDYGHPVVPVSAVVPVSSSAPKVISQETIQAISAEASQANVEQLHLMLSRLMASSATAVETQPIADAARQLSQAAGDDLVIARARLLSERVAQYQRVAVRRDGQTVVRAGGGSGASLSLGSPVITASASTPVSDNGNAMLPTANVQTASASQPVVPQSQAAGVTGYLVQVYSARQNSPPYALTDNLGNTVAYVTPAPGVNIRHHINSEVTVAGNQGYVQGLNTPHIVANQAVRVASQPAPVRR
jgi:SH3-like domain-containing protein